MLNIRKKVAVSVILALGFIGCGGGGNTPRDVAVELTENVYKGDIDFLLTEMEAALRKELEGLKEEARGFESAEVLSESIEGDKAVVQLRVNYKDGGNGTTYVNLKKIDGKWAITR